MVNTDQTSLCALPYSLSGVKMADSVAPLPPQPLSPTSPGANNPLKVLNPWRTAIPNSDRKQPDSDSSFLAERGHYRRPRSI